MVQYNILAGSLGLPRFFPHSKPEALRWGSRRERIVGELRALDADIVCLEELDDYWNYFQPQLEALGYRSVYAKRPSLYFSSTSWSQGYRYDGSGIFYRSKRFQLIDTITVFFTDGEDRVAQLLLLRDAHCPPPPAPPRHLLVACTHLHWDASRASQKLEVRQLRHDLHAWVRRVASDAGVDLRSIALVLAGDMNNTPGSHIYSFLAEQLGRPEHDSAAAGAHSGGEHGAQAAWEAPLRSAYAVHAALARGESLPAADGACVLDVDASAAGEPPHTTISARRCHTIDYIWYDCSRLGVRALLEVPSAEELCAEQGPPGWLGRLTAGTRESMVQQARRRGAPERATDEEVERVLCGIPSSRFPSDHIPLYAEFGWVA